MSASAKGSARAHVLVVEDSAVFREMQEILLGQAGYVVSSHENPTTALAAAAKQTFDLVVIDYELPAMNGELFMHALRKIQPDIEVVFVSGALTEELVVRLSSQRLAGIFHKPTNPKILLERIDETLARNTARDTAVRVGSGAPLPHGRRGNSASPLGNLPELAADGLAYMPRFVFGSSDTFREFSHRLWKVRDFRAVLLLQGEVGSPFELLARELAEISLFRDGPVMLCEGARFEARRLIEVLAPCLLSHDAGTLLVTGVEAFTPEQQKTLENLITGRDVFLPFARRFRLVLAATSELSERVDEGAFGETLFYKVSALTLTVPALRDMRSDILVNAQRILAMHREAGHANTPLNIAADAAEWMQAQDWPGNYDELARTMLNAARFAQGEQLTLDAISAGWPTEEIASAVTASSSAPTANEADGHPKSDARPPFPIHSMIASDVGVIAASVVADSSVPAAAVGMTAPPPVASIAQAPASQLFGRRPKPVPVITAQSLFRPASSSYNFASRLAATLNMAETAPAH